MKALLVTLIAAAATAATMGAAQAQSFDASKAYVGIGGVTAKNESVDGWRFGEKLFAGYDINQNWGAEAGYTRFDSASRGTLNTNAYQGYIAAKYTMPLNEQVSAYAKLGASRAVRKASDIGVSYREADNSGYGALGLKYKLDQNLALGLEYERNGTQKQVGPKADSIGLNLAYGF